MPSSLVFFAGRMASESMYAYFWTRRKQYAVIYVTVICHALSSAKVHYGHNHLIGAQLTTPVHEEVIDWKDLLRLLGMNDWGRNLVQSVLFFGDMDSSFDLRSTTKYPKKFFCVP